MTLDIRTGWRGCVGIYSRVLLDLFLVITLLGFFSKFFWLFDILSGFRVQCAIALLAIAGGLAFARRRKEAVVALVFVGVNAATILPLYQRPPASTTSSGPSLRVLYVNVNYGNDQYEWTTRRVKEFDPDIVAVSEVTDAWKNALLLAFPDYKYFIVAPRPDAFGIALFSRVPLARTEVVYWGRAGVPSIVSEVDFDGTPTSIIVSHPIPPLSETYFDLRNDQLRSIEAHRPELHKSLIVAADLNTTSWSHTFQRFLKRMGLRDTELGFGVQPSWPDRGMPSLWDLLWIPIDHLLVSPDWQTVKRHVGGPIGSDHRPVFVELRRRG